MLKVGLTGGIGCGKSTAVDAFRALGVPIIDADQISKKLVKKGSDALLEIAKTFGQEIILNDGKLNRPLLKEKIFSNSIALNQLEAILHPKIKAEISNQISLLENTSNLPSYIIVDVPLLVEKNYQSLFDRIIVVDCLPEQQLERVANRDGMNSHTITKIIKVQASREQRKEIATDILDNTGDVDTLLTQIKTLHEALLWPTMNNH